jgi:hypothetical protein
MPRTTIAGKPIARSSRMMDVMSVNFVFHCQVERIIASLHPPLVGQCIAVEL